MERIEVLRKCLVVFEAIRRAASKGNAGLEPCKGAEESYNTDSEICDELRKMIREQQAGETKNWQKEIMAAGGPPERLVF